MNQENKQKVSISTNGELEIISDMGVYETGTQSCVISGDFIIGADSVRNLIISFDKNEGGFKKVSHYWSNKHGWLYVSEKDIINDFEGENKKLQEKVDLLQHQLRYANEQLQDREIVINHLNKKLETINQENKWWKFLFKKKK